MEGLIEDIVQDLQDENGRSFIYGSQFIERLELAGYMIVPIEDPTNLRFGVE